MGFMRKSVGVLAAVVMAAAGTCYAADKVENPQYKQWSKFKAGTTVTFKTEMSMAGAPSSDRTMTLLEVTPEKAVVETKMSMMVQGKPMDMPAQKMEIPAMTEKVEAPAATGPKPEVKESAEEVDVAGTKVKCKVMETTMDVSGTKMTNKTWMSDDVPGGMVKMENTSMKMSITAMTIK